MRRAANIVLATGLCAVVTVVRADASLSGQAATVLLEALQAQYRQVVYWDLQPLGRVDREPQERAATAQIRVLQLGPRSAVQLRMRDDEGELLRRTLWFSVQGMQSVLTAGRGLAAGTALATEDVEVRERDVLAANCEPLVEPAQLEGMRMKTAVRAGAVLCARALEPRPPVARGEAVTVRYLGRSVAVTTRGVAQADADLGRPVMIRNPSSHQTFRAVVSGPGEVTIHD